MADDKEKEVKKPGDLTKETKKPSELSDEDLEKAAGGTGIPSHPCTYHN